MLTPLEQASGILGEHMVNYVIVVSSPDAPNHAQIAYDSKYAASGLVKHAQKMYSQKRLSSTANMKSCGTTKNKRKNNYVPTNK